MKNVKNKSTSASDSSVSNNNRKKAATSVKSVKSVKKMETKSKDNPLASETLAQLQSNVAKTVTSAPSVDVQLSSGKSPLLAIHNLNQFIGNVFDGVTEDNPTTTQYELLHAIHLLNLPNQTQIGEITRMDRSTVAEVVRRLVKRGFINRVRSEKDERAWLMSLTDDGRSALIRGQKAMQIVKNKLSRVPGLQHTLDWAMDILEANQPKDPVDEKRVPEQNKESKSGATTEASNSSQKKYATNNTNTNANRSGRVRDGFDRDDRELITEDGTSNGDDNVEGNVDTERVT